MGEEQSFTPLENAGAPENYNGRLSHMITPINGSTHILVGSRKGRLTTCTNVRYLNLVNR